MPYIKISLKNIFNVERIVSIFEIDTPADFVFDGESHDFWELRYIEEGEIYIHRGKELCRMREGDIFFHAPGEFHDLIGDNVHTAKIAIISFECHSSSMEYFKGKRLEVPKEMRFRISEILKTAEDCFEKNIPWLALNPDAPFGSEQILRGELEGFFIRLIQNEERGGTKVFFTSRNELLDKLHSDIIEYLESHLYDSVSLDELSQIFHFGKSHICHVFKEKTGTTVKQYFIKAKLGEAKRLLTEDSSSVSYISNLLHFESPQYFAKIFKREYGVTPSEYRKNFRL